MRLRNKVLVTVGGFLSVISMGDTSEGPNLIATLSTLAVGLVLIGLAVHNENKSEEEEDYYEY